jgi:hypothetical protein
LFKRSIEISLSDGLTTIDAFFISLGVREA